MTAFLVGFEELANSLSETSKLVDLMSLHNLVSSKATLQEKIYHCKSAVSLLFGSYHFFLSAVNRATDFTRCFHKISLIPKIAPINLTESLISAISVIKQVQGKICIELNIVHRENMSEYILTDGDWFKDNLLCLLENAIRWSDVQFAAVYVKKFLMNEQPFLRIEVEDSGPGFPFDHKTTNDVSVVDQTILNNIKKKIEDPNYSNRVDLGGLGLGLYCLSQRVYALHGDYGIKRRKKGQRGSIVWFSFPYKDYRPTKELLSVTKANKKLLMYTPNDPANTKEEHYDYDGEHNAEEIRKMDNTGTIHYEESEESEESGGTTEYSNLLPDIPTIIQPKKILIAEDSIPVAKLISSSLIRRGFETVLVANGLEAVEAVRDKSLSSEMISSISDGESEGIPYFLEHFDAILMDLQMPVMTGLDACHDWSGGNL